MREGGYVASGFLMETPQEERIRAFEIDATTGAFASVGMSLTAIFAGLVLPWVLRLM